MKIGLALLGMLLIEGSIFAQTGVEETVKKGVDKVKETTSSWMTSEHHHLGGGWFPLVFSSQSKDALIGVNLHGYYEYHYNQWGFKGILASLRTDPLGGSDTINHTHLGGVVKYYENVDFFGDLRVSGGGGLASSKLEFGKSDVSGISLVVELEVAKKLNEFVNVYANRLTFYGEANSVKLGTDSWGIGVDVRLF